MDVVTKVLGRGKARSIQRKEGPWRRTTQHGNG